MVECLLRLVLRQAAAEPALLKPAHSLHHSEIPVPHEHSLSRATASARDEARLVERDSDVSAVADSVHRHKRHRGAKAPERQSPWQGTTVWRCHFGAKRLSHREREHSTVGVGAGLAGGLAGKYKRWHSAEFSASIWFSSTEIHLTRLTKSGWSACNSPRCSSLQRQTTHVPSLSADAHAHAQATSVPIHL